MSYDFDAIVIGAGSGGLTAAVGLSKAKKKVLLVEVNRMGGECTNTGCIPSKTFLHLAREYAIAKKLSGETQQLQEFRKQIFEKIRKKIEEVRAQETPELLASSYGIRVTLGEASFLGSHSIRIQKRMDHEDVTAKWIIIATGSSPIILEIPGLLPEKILTNESIFSLQEIPDQLLILGGGPIGCEMAQAFSDIGTLVTLVSKSDRLLPKENPEISSGVLESFKQSNIAVHLDSQIDHIEGNHALVKQGRTHHRVPFGFVLEGLGRTPNVARLNLEAAKIEQYAEGIMVDKHFRTTQSNIFAIGDVTTGAKFTHLADDEARHVVKKIVLGPLQPYETDKPLPWVTYLKEEVAHVGRTYEEAVELYSARGIYKIEIPFSSLDRAKTDYATDGQAIVIVKRLSGKVLGASIRGKNAGELISLFTLAVQQKLSLFTINRMIVPYPTFSQIYRKLSDEFLALSLKNFRTDLFYAIRRHAPRILALMAWIIILSAFFWIKSRYDLSSLDLVKKLYFTLSSSSIGPLLFILAYALRPIIFFPATFLTVLAGVIWGFWLGFFYTLIAGTISALVAYSIARFFAEDFLVLNSKHPLLSTWRQELQKNAFFSVLIMRLLYLPFDLINYVCGLLNVGWKPFALATALGMVVDSIGFISFGATLDNVESFKLSEISINGTQLLISIFLILLSFVIAVAVHQYRQRQGKIAEPLS